MSLNDRRNGKDRRKEKRDTLDSRKNKDRRAHCGCAAHGLRPRDTSEYL